MSSSACCVRCCLQLASRLPVQKGREREKGARKKLQSYGDACCGSPYQPVKLLVDTRGTARRRHRSARGGEAVCGHAEHGVDGFELCGSGGNASCCICTCMRGGGRGEGEVVRVQTLRPHHARQRTCCRVHSRALRSLPPPFEEGRDTQGRKDNCSGYSSHAEKAPLLRRVWLSG